LINKRIESVENNGFCLFWWSILGEMLDYSDNPTQTFGIELSANVFGILCGGF